MTVLWELATSVVLLTFQSLKNPHCFLLFSEKFAVDWTFVDQGAGT